jgi:O-acetylhomoserine/O-acetylserine sulfhydrylase-like pyridoxal-dependent enzyme
MLSSTTRARARKESMMDERVAFLQSIAAAVEFASDMDTVDLSVLDNEQTGDMVIRNEELMVRLTVEQVQLVPD